MTDIVLSIDLGTSSIKLLAVNRDGTIVDRRSLPHDTWHPSSDAAEQEPSAWWEHIADGIRTIVPAGVSVAAIGVTGQMHGLVLHDYRGQPLRPAIIWQDRRSVATLPDLRRLLEPPAASRIAPGFQAATWHWLHASEPGTGSTAHRILLPKDEIIFRLTGEHVTDPSDAVGSGWFDAAAGDWDAAVLAAAQAERRLLPRIVPSGAIAGTLMPESAAELGLDTGIPVVVAGGDAATGAFGAGAAETTPLLMLSTGCQVLQPVGDHPNDPCWPAAAPAGLPRWLRVAATLNGGNAVRWARETFGEPAAVSDHELVFLPYLAGERSNDVGSEAAGAFLGLRAHHDRPNLSRAALDGVALAIADAFAGIGGELAMDDPILVGGGGVRDEAWLASVARVLGRPLQVIDEADLSARGAARSAAAAIGWINPVTDSTAWLPASRLVETPALPPGVVYERLARFRDLGQRLYGAVR